jgi:hypothetical protein
MTRLDTGKFGIDSGVVSVATREPIDVKRVLEATRAIENDEELDTSWLISRST